MRLPLRESVLPLLAGTVLFRHLLRGRRRIEFNDRVVVITGGSRGLGLAMAREFALQGARLAICARDPDELENARRDLEARGTRPVLAVSCDISDPDEAERFVRRVVERFGRLDVLVNNAGIMQVGPVTTVSLRDLRRVMDVNFWGSVHMTFAALPKLLEQRFGRIVNITSIGGVVPVPRMLPYTCSKFGLVGFSNGLALEVAKRGIRVTTVVPGLMRTGSFMNALFKGDRKKEVRWFSLGASLPGISMSAERAARRIVRACRHGDYFVTLGLPAKVLRLGYDEMPGVTTAILAGMDRALPCAPSQMSEEGEAEPGWRHRTGIARSWITRLGDRASERLNERVAQRGARFEGKTRLSS